MEERINAVLSFDSVLYLDQTLLTALLPLMIMNTFLPTGRFLILLNASATGRALVVAILELRMPSSLR